MQAILFDIDGTLIHTRGAGRAALSSAFAEVFDRKDVYEIDTRGRTDRAIMRDLLLAHRIDESPELLRRLSAAYLRHLPQQMHECNGCVLPGVRELLALLAECNNLHLGLLTGNTAEGARLKLAHFGLHQHFAFGGYGDAHDDRNLVAADACEQLRLRCDGEVRADRVWVVGDTPHDIRCARHIGAKVLAVATGSHARDELAAARPDVLLDDLSEVATVLEKLAG